MVIKTTKRDVVWNYIGTAFSMSSQFLLLPFLLLYLSNEELGLWYIFLAISSVVALFDFGFSPTFGRNVTYCWSGAERLTKEGCEYSENKEVNYKLLKKIIITCRILYALISSIALGLIGSIGTLYIIHLSGDLEGYNHLIAWAIFCIAVFLNLYFGYFLALLRGVGALYKVNHATIFSRLAQILITILLLFLGWGLIGASIGFLMNGIILRFICQNAFYKHQGIKSNLDAVEEKITKKEVFDSYRIVSYNAYKEGIVSLSNYLASQSSSIIASLFLSLAQTGIYAISLQFATAIANLSASLVLAQRPALQSAFISGDEKSVKKLTINGMFVYYFLYFFGVLSVVLLVFPLLRLVRPDVIFDLPIFFGLAIYIFLWKNQSLFAAYIGNTNRVPYMKAFFLSSILGVIVSIIFVYYLNFGLWGIILGPGVVQLGYNNWKWMFFVLNEIQVSFFQFFVLGSQELKNILLSFFKKGY